MNLVLQQELQSIAAALDRDLPDSLQASTAFATGSDVLLAVWDWLDLRLPADSWYQPPVITAADYARRVVQWRAVLALPVGETGVVGLVQQALLRAAIRTAVLRGYESVNQAQAVQAELFALSQQQGHPLQAREWLTLLRSAVEQQRETLPHVERVPVRNVSASLLLAYERYEDISRESDIVQRNAIRHPGFIAPGSELEVLSE